MTFLLLYWKWIAAAALIGVLTIGYNVHVNGLIDDAVKKAVIGRDNAWRDEEKAQIAKADKVARATEVAHAADLAKIQTDYQKDLANEKTQRANDVAAARAGALKLRFSAASPSTCVDPKAASPAGGSNDSPTAELPPTVTADLFALVNDADAIVNQLTKCQAVITSDRSSP